MVKHIFTFFLIVFLVQNLHAQDNNVLKEEFQIRVSESGTLSGTLYFNKKSSRDKIKTIRIWLQVYPETQKRVADYSEFEVEVLGSDLNLAYATFDYRGYGKSTGSRSFTAIADDLDAVKSYLRKKFGSDLRIETMGYTGNGLATEIRNIGFKNTVVPAYLYKPPTVIAGKPVAVVFSPLGQWSPLCDSLSAGLSLRGIPVIGVISGQFLISLKKEGGSSPQNVSRLIRELVKKADISPDSSKIVFAGEEFGANTLLAAEYGRDISEKTIMINPLHIQLNRQKYFRRLLDEKHFTHYNGTTLLKDNENVFLFYDNTNTRIYAEIIEKLIRPGMPPNHVFILTPEKREHRDGYYLRLFVTRLIQNGSLR